MYIDTNISILHTNSNILLYNNVLYLLLLLLFFFINVLCIYIYIYVYMYPFDLVASQKKGWRVAAKEKEKKKNTVP